MNMKMMILKKKRQRKKRKTEKKRCGYEVAVNGPMIIG